MSSNYAGAARLTSPSPKQGDSTAPDISQLRLDWIALWEDGFILGTLSAATDAGLGDLLDYYGSGLQRKVPNSTSLPSFEVC